MLKRIKTSFKIQYYSPIKLVKDLKKTTDTLQDLVMIY